MGLMLGQQFCYPKTKLSQFINKLFFGLFMVLHVRLLLRGRYAFDGVFRVLSSQID